ncbi:sulfite oxidase-like oxidoreductase [Candidatus Pacearchaeota archaeon]|nr:sulfite oxidase-like oxidoreductase [Candidatus Pacearchaeota archaeon]
MIINKGFTQKRTSNGRLPPGQYETKDFPVLSLGPTPRVTKESWALEVKGLATPMKWNWKEFTSFPIENIKTDIHCVTRWSKFDTMWKGVSIDHIMKKAKVSNRATHLIAHSYDGYTTNIPIADIMGGKAWVAIEYEGKDIEADHGGPARLFIPHLYFWKSAKWLKALEFVQGDHPGFWETRGYHNYGDPWKEQRYTFD